MKEAVPLEIQVEAEIRKSLPDSTKIELTGNPYVDTGLAVVAARCGYDSIDNLVLGDLRSIHKDGLWLARECEPLKCFTMIFNGAF